MALVVFSTPENLNWLCSNNKRKLHVVFFKGNEWAVFRRSNVFLLYSRKYWRQMQVPRWVICGTPPLWKRLSLSKWVNTVKSKAICLLTSLCHRLSFGCCSVVSVANCDCSCHGHCSQFGNLTVIFLEGISQVFSCDFSLSYSTPDAEMTYPSPLIYRSTLHPPRTCTPSKGGC